MIERELGWDDEIQNDGEEFTLLEPGEYSFFVKSFEKKRFAGSAKLPPCNMATLKIRIEDKATVEHNLYLHTKTEGLICAFFRAIGSRKHGERIVPDWSKVPGSSGRCVVEIREWTGRDGNVMKSNQIKKFLDPVDAENAPF
jgi:hypothetical protein